MTTPKPGGRKSTAEVELRVEFVAELLARGLRFVAVKRRIRMEFGGLLSARQILCYVSRARVILAKECERPKRELLGEAVEFYNSILRDPKAPYGARIDARTRLDRLFGLETSQRFELAGVPDAPPIQLSCDEALMKVYRDEALKLFCDQLNSPSATSPPNGRTGRNGDCAKGR